MNKKEFLQQLKNKKEIALWEEELMAKYYNRKILSGDNIWQENLKMVKIKIKGLRDLIEILDEEIKEV